MTEWLGDRKWDVIHFNWGLHDLKYVNAKGQLTDTDNGKQLASIDQYKKNLEELVVRLKTTGAKLIWATTTQAPAGSKGRKKGDAMKYNAAAREIANKHHATINDLYALVLPQLKEIQRPKNVHFTKAGSEILAEQVAVAILVALIE